MKDIDLKKYAIKYLSKYDSTKTNLKNILLKKIRNIKLPNEINKNNLISSIDKIIEELSKKKLIDEKNFIETKINNLSLQGRSKMFIKNKLLQKGANKKLIDDLLKEFDNNNQNWEYESAKKYAIKKKLGKYGSSDNKRKDLSSMSRAGFSYDISIKILEYE